MFRDIATRDIDIKQNKTKYPKYMSISHCIDQHCFPNIVYFYNPKVIHTLITKTNTLPFRPLFSKLFNEITGINPRKIPNFNFEKWISLLNQVTRKLWINLV